MSGGVDSSVAAHLLRAAGHEVIGVFMRHGEASPAVCHSGANSQLSDTGPQGAQLNIITAPSRAAANPHKQGCCTASDADDARRVAARLDIPFYAVDFAEEFGRIMDYFVDEYTAGRTPNPCVVCNTWLKFGKLAEYADSVGAEYIATGHYARLIPSNTAGGSPALSRGVDPTKDQSYVLFGLDRSILSRVLLPVGDYRKAAIREIAQELGMRVADKRDSQEICFVPDGDYAEFIRRRRHDDHDRTGEIVTTAGAVVGQHSGIEQFTVGQRKGLNVAFGEPRYVVRLEPDTRRVVIGSRDELGRSDLTAGRVNWLIDAPTEPFACDVKIRYKTPQAPATVEPLAEGRFRVRFDEPQQGVAPGQAAVCYDGDRVLGGGWIE
jgi:tRNA-specific 2-thiouridylase